MDFTIKTYRLLIKTLLEKGYSFRRFDEFIENPGKKVVILRHDIDRKPGNALEFARIEQEAGIRGTYYFRIVPEAWDEEIIKEIAEMGHEIGYHYEDVGMMAGRGGWARGRVGEGARGRLGDEVTEGRSDEGMKRRSDVETDSEEELAGMAIESFKVNLERLRHIAPVKTICMHGSPLSRWDNRLLWKYYDYHDFGIIGEPYFDVNFDQVLYLTDTGRRWDGDVVSIRDKAEGRRLEAEGREKVSCLKESMLQCEEPLNGWKVKPVKGSLMNMTAEGLEFKMKYNFRSTDEIIKAVNQEIFPEKVIITFHPQRWTDKLLPWLKELFWQNAKNVGKYMINSLKAEGKR